MKIGSWIAESVSILNTSKNRYVFTADFLLFNFEVLFSSQENAILSFDVNAPQLTSCVALCVNKSSRHFTRIKCLSSIIVSKLECHILTKVRIRKNLNIFKTRLKLYLCYLDFNLHFKFIRIARLCVIKRYMYLFCTMDCFQVHPFIVNMIIKSDTSSIKIIVHRIYKYYWCLHIVCMYMY